MWETNYSTSHGGFSVRRLVAYALTAMVAVFLWVLVASPAAHAADAMWSGTDVMYQGKKFNPMTADGKNPPNLSKGTTYYLNEDSPNIFSGNSKSYIIYFPSKSNSTSAKYQAYETDSSGNYGKRIADQTISVASKSAGPSSKNAAWVGTNLQYDGNTYNGKGNGPIIADGTSGPNLPKGTQYYTHPGVPDLFGNSTNSVIYFPADSNVATAKSAKYVTYSVNSNDEWKSPSSAKTISVTPRAVTNPTDQNGDVAGQTTCAIDGIGWIVCPLSSFLATGMDNAFKILEGFLLVQPLTGDTGSSMYKAWTYARSLANIAFVIAFLIIIFSQLTSTGVTNYGIKKLLPRLIVAAILVNVSFYICSLAIDASNILGDSVQKILIAVRESLTAPNTNKLNSWESVSGFILAGGTAAAAAAVGVSATIIATGASAGAAVILLLPMLLGLIVAVLIALVVLAARQAVITMLVIAAPLAFVAYLLPNTEKWFEKWRETLTTLLVFFPIFSLIFGGSQLAGYLIMQNTDQITVILLGMFVQVAPLVITPMLIKFSGSIVSRIANMVNNPSKGIIDRTRNWAKEQADVMAKKNMARNDPVRRRQVFRRFALGYDQYKRIQDAHKNMYSTQADARWTNSKDFSDIDQGQRRAQEEKGLGESLSEARYAKSKTTVGAIRDLDIKVRNVKLDIEGANIDSDINWERNHDPLVAEKKLHVRTANDTIAALKSTEDAEYEEFKAGRSRAYPNTTQVAQMLYQSQLDTQRLAANAMRKAFATQVQHEQFTDASLQNTVRIDGQLINNYAGGIHAKGAERVLAQALTEQHKARAESIANANAILEHSNLSSAEVTEISKNVSVKGVIVTEDIREAAIKRVASTGTIPQIDDMLRSVDLSPTGNENFRLTLVEALRGNANRPKYIGQGIMDQLTQGITGGVSQATIDGWVEKMIIDGKLSAAELSKQDRDTLVRVSEALDRIPRTPVFNAALTGLNTEISDLQRNNQLWNATGERKGVIEQISAKI